MRTYDPAQGIRYVHLAPEAPAAPAVPPAPVPGCSRLAAGYGNGLLRPRPAAGPAPVLVLIEGGAEAIAAAVPALRLA